MKLDDDFHETIPIGLKKIRDSVLAQRKAHGSIEYFVIGSPLSPQRVKQNWSEG